jgi:mRNA-degrading endonuclease YafQ of YafQ-DinJ toxin-antitoxin module
MNWAISTTSHFDRQVAKFRRQHPDLRRRLSDTLRDLAIDPHQPRLRLHALSGKLAGYHAARTTYGHRIVLILRVTEHELTLHDIGDHDDVYR